MSHGIFVSDLCGTRQKTPPLPPAGLSRPSQEGVAFKVFEVFQSPTRRSKPGFSFSKCKGSHGQDPHAGVPGAEEVLTRKEAGITKS